MLEPVDLGAVRGRVRERADDLEQLDHRAGPAVGHDQRQRVLMTLVNCGSAFSFASALRQS